MSTFLSNRDGGLTDEEGHYRFQTNVWDGEVIGTGLLVTENSPLGMSVLVNGGDAKVPYLDYAYTVWIPDASPEVATITTADPTNPRIDRVVLYVDRAESPQQVTPNNPGIPKIAVVAGTPGAVPVRPNDAAVDTAVSNEPWIDLADVRVNATVTQITNSNITDTRDPVTVTATNIPEAFFRGRRKVISTVTQPTGLTIQFGWDYQVGDNTTNIEKAITFPTAFSSPPMVFVNQMAARPTASGAPDSTDDFTTAFSNHAGAYPDDITTTGFNASLVSTAANFSSTFNFGISWIAIGTV